MPTNTADIVLSLTWDQRLEDLYRSWHREVGLAEGHTGAARTS